MDGERSYEYEGVGLSANDVADIPRGTFPKEIYKENELSLCRGCAFLDRNCSAIPITIFRDRDSNFYTSLCRGWKRKNEKEMPSHPMLNMNRPKPLPLSSMGTKMNGGSRG